MGVGEDDYRSGPKALSSLIISIYENKTETMPALTKKYLKLTRVPITSLRNFLYDINTLRLKNNTFITDRLFRSNSDNGIYPELALKAANDPNTFSVFRRCRRYTEILEHVSAEQGESYLNIITDEYGWSPKEVLDAIAPLQQIGQPVLKKIRGLPESISTTALRYLKVALDIKASRGSKLGHVVEIGCGYGGQAVILDRVAEIKSYTFIDLWQVNALIQRFIEASPLSCNYNLSTLRQGGRSRESWDLVISNYAFSELPNALQQSYLTKIIKRSNHGYMTMNSGMDGYFGGMQHMSIKELQNALPNSSIQEERPLTYSKNYILTW